jgi:hypothetical protein
MTTAIKSPAANQNLQIRGRCGAIGPESVIQTKIATYRRALRNTSPPNPSPFWRGGIRRICVHLSAISDHFCSRLVALQKGDGPRRRKLLPKQEPGPPKTLLIGAKPRISFLILGAGLGPAEGSVKPTAGLTFNYAHVPVPLILTTTLRRFGSLLVILSLPCAFPFTVGAN